MRRERLIKELSGDSERSSGTSGPVGPIHVNKQDKAIRFAVARISLYCVVPLISQFFNIALDTMYYVAPTWRYQPLLVLLANLFGGLQGTFNGIVFLIFDPACVATRETIRENLLSKYCLPYVQLPASPATSGQLLDADNDSDMMRSSAAVLEKLPSGIMSTSMASTSQGNVFSQQPQPSAVAFAANHQPPTKTQSPTLSAKQSSRPALSNLSPLKRRSVPNTVEPETSLPHPHIAATSAVSTSSITHTQNAGGGGASANSPGTLAPYNGTLVPHRSTDIILKRLQPVFRRYPPNLLHRTYFWVVWLLCVRQKDYEKYYTGTITNKGSAAKNGERKSRKKKQREAALAAL
ncbi:hypothetical protein DFS34DRAFT_628100 [Phlyctochytrium arcticum]|nr:hypothetical protein DFS34DRAFT_628100 [Phlyctochytrium arcticum]